MTAQGTGPIQVSVRRRDGDIAIIQVDNPPVNALTAGVPDELLTAVTLAPWRGRTAAAYVKFGIYERPTLGIAVAMLLVLVLDGIFAGAMRQVTAYLRTSPADAIVSQQSVRTMHMSLSALPASTTRSLSDSRPVAMTRSSSSCVPVSWNGICPSRTESSRRVSRSMPSTRRPAFCSFVNASRNPHASRVQPGVLALG